MTSNYKQAEREWREAARKEAELASREGREPRVGPRPIAPPSGAAVEEQNLSGDGHLSSGTRAQRRALRQVQREEAEAERDDSGYVPPPHIARMADELIKRLMPAFEQVVERVLARRKGGY